MHCFNPPATAVTGKFVHERSHSDTPTPLPVPVDLSAESRLVLKKIYNLIFHNINCFYIVFIVLLHH